MKQTLLPIEFELFYPDRRLPRRRIGAASPSAGFFTIGFAIAVLATGALVAGAGKAVVASESASAPTPSRASAERPQPVDVPKADGESNVVISKAPAGARNSAGGDSRSLQ